MISQKTDRRRLLFGGAATMLLGATGCGYLLYPERRGRTGGRTDVPVLIVDLLWLLVGVVPGVICLVVDFSTGCIYEGSRLHVSAPAEKGPLEAMVAVHLDGEVVATGQLQADGAAHLVWTRRPELAALRERGRLVVRAGGDAVAEAQVGAFI